MNSNVALDRDALYYPYIHISDVNWLKATLLSFPGVRRMVPGGGYNPQDEPEIAEFCNTEGPRGPLLTSVDLFGPEAHSAEMSLLRKLQDNDDFIRSHYSKHKTIEAYGKSANLFTIHDEKIILPLYDHVTQGGDNALAWHSDKPQGRPDRGDGHWLALHPALGEAILATKAVAIAESSGLSIVTDSDYVHHTVALQEKDHIFENLIRKPVSSVPPDEYQTIDDLSEIVISVNFDVSKFTAKDIASLHADGKDLRRFKDALVPFAQHIPPMTNQKERKKRLEEAAAEVIKEWQKYKKSLPRLALDAISDATAIKAPDAITSLLLGTGTAICLSAAAGITILLVSYSGFRVWRKYREQTASPYSYLSRIRALHNRTIPNLTLPPTVYPGM